MPRKELAIGGFKVAPGSRTTIPLTVARLYTYTPMTMPVHVVHGRRPGPTLFLSAAVHGDELNGVEIIRRVLRLKILSRLHGTLIAIPIVNVYGVIHHSRYLPDRRDLNRNFPGLEQGSLTARLAHLLQTEILGHCDYGIDLHTGALHRENLPHVRANLDDPETDHMARAFGTPLLLDTAMRDGSLRQAAAELGVRMMVYEAGEALRFDEVAIRAGIRGITEVMRVIGMLAPGKRRRKRIEPLVAHASSWIRASESGILRPSARLGERVRKGNRLGIIADPFGTEETEVSCPAEGIVIARLNLPLVNQGDALFHLARFHEPEEAADRVQAFQDAYLEPDTYPGVER